MNDTNEVCDFYDYYLQNQKFFIDKLIESSSEDLIREIDRNKLLDKSHLIETAELLVKYLGDESNKEQLKKEAKSRGKDWANSNLDISLKLEYFKNFRKTYWNLIQKYQINITKQEFLTFELECKVNYSLDKFINEYVKSYSDTKNIKIASQKTTIEELTTPLIPLSDTMAVLPLIGEIDLDRIEKIQEQTMFNVSLNNLDKIFIDLSGVAYIDPLVIDYILSLVDGLRLLGCSSTLTGVNPKMASDMVKSGISLDSIPTIKGTLKNALEEKYFS